MPKKAPIGVRFERDELAALIKAANADDRPASALVRKIVVEWLRRLNWLNEAPNSTRRDSSANDGDSK